VAIPAGAWRREPVVESAVVAGPRDRSRAIWKIQLKDRWNVKLREYRRGVRLRNSLKEKLREKKTTYGTAITIGHPDISDILGNVGFDWIMVDQEHAPLSVGDIAHLFQAMSYSETVPITRVPWNDVVMVKRSLDQGAMGVVFPWISTKDDAIRAVQSTRYPPQGVRGWGPRLTGLKNPNYFAEANKEIFVGAQIETAQAIENIDEILSVEGIDAALVGPNDLSISLGIPRQWDHPKFKDALAKILESSEKHNVTPGMLAPTEWQKRMKEGFRMMMLPCDFDLLNTAARQAIKDAKDFASTL